MQSYLSGHDPILRGGRAQRVGAKVQTGGPRGRLGPMGVAADDLAHATSCGRSQAADCFTAAVPYFAFCAYEVTSAKHICPSFIISMNSCW